jgi:hypothetical protein
MVNMFCISPALLNEVELAMKFWQEYYLKSLGMTDSFENDGDENECRWREQTTTNTNRVLTTNTETRRKSTAWDKLRLGGDREG